MEFNDPSKNTPNGDTAGNITMESDTFSLHVGDHVRLVNDDWNLVGHDIVLVDAEPVPGSTQCIVSADGEMRFVSRFDLRRV